MVLFTIIANARRERALMYCVCYKRGYVWRTFFLGTYGTFILSVYVFESVKGNVQCEWALTLQLLCHNRNREI